MIVTLDGRRLPDPGLVDVTLQHVIDRVRAQHVTGGIIVGVRINGSDLTDARLEQELNRRIESTIQIDLETASGADIAAQALAQAAGNMRELPAAAELIAESLIAGRTADAVQKIVTFVSVWQMCRQVVAQSNDVAGRDLTAEQFDGRVVAGHVDDLVVKMREIRDALEARDMVLLADLFQYEMPQLCKLWTDLLSTLADSLRGAVPAR